MKLVGSYVTFSELYDRRPTQEELVGTVRDLALERALLILVRMNLALRHALHEETKDFGKLQATLGVTFCEDETLNRYRQRFAFNRPEEKPLFVPIQCLNVMRTALLEGRELSPVPSDEQLQHLLGRACLIMGDLLLSEKEKGQIEEGDKDSRRLTLMVQMLAPFELSNPTSSHRLVLRYQQMYRNVLQMPEVRRRIREECNSFDFDQVFGELTGLTLERWLHAIFAIYGYYLASADPWQGDERYFLIDPETFTGTSDLSTREAKAIFTTISATPDQLKKQLESENHTDPRFDFLPFRTNPLVQISNGKLACLDSTFLLNQVHTGVHWVMHDRLSKSKRGDLFKAWGVLFEEYLHHLFQAMNTSIPVSYYRGPRWTKGTKDNIHQESFDGLFVRNTVLFPMEFKGGFLSRKARYSGDVNVFVSEMRDKFAGPQQLAWKIGALFAENESKRSAIEHINADAYDVVVPILIFHDQILRVPLLNWWLNLEFQQELRKYPLRPGVKVEPLTVASVQEIEGMVNSAETSNFDFLYAMHHRAVRDPEMLSNLLDFLFQFPTFGKGNSKRVQAILDEWGKELWRTLFPGEEEEVPELVKQ